jgi:hypothetical protein
MFPYDPVVQLVEITRTELTVSVRPLPLSSPLGVVLVDGSLCWTHRCSA